ETLREYASGKLASSDEAVQYKSKHKDYFLTFAADAASQLKGPQQDEWLETLETEHDNLRAALAWCREAQDSARDGLRLAGTLWRFWLSRGHWSEGREHLERALNACAGLPNSTEKALALRGAGSLATITGDTATARPRFEEALAIFRELDD